MGVSNLIMGLPCSWAILSLKVDILEMKVVKIM